MKLFFAVENVRSIKNMEFVELKPITILLGANNSGKSAFLRVFPLLRQSIEKTKVPIEWNGNYVEYGGYKNAVTDYNSRTDISFRFKIKDVILRNTIMQSDSSKDPEVRINFDDIGYSVVIGQSEVGTVIKKIQANLTDLDIKIEIVFKDYGYQIDKFAINKKDLCSLSKDNIFRVAKIKIDHNKIFPTFQLIGKSHNNGYSANFEGVLSEILQDLLYENLNETMSSEDSNFIQDLAHGILSVPNFNTRRIDDIIKNKSDKRIKKILMELKKYNNVIKNLNHICRAYWSFTALNAISEIFGNFFLDNSYIKSDRTNSKSSYNYEDLNVTEIDPEGKNLAMYLASLNKNEFESFSIWVEGILNVKLKIERISDGLISVMFTRKKSEVNFAYTGYGISQILPILAQFWLTAHEDTMRELRSRKDNYYISDKLMKPITIEHPESHLHPKHQSGIADALVSVLKEKNENIDPIFVLETHSKPFIDRLGRLVEDKRISRDDINIILFSETQDKHNFEETNLLENFHCHISESQFDQDGILQNWPFGFLG